MGPVPICHSSHDFGWQSSHSVDLAGWQAKMASIEIFFKRQEDRQNGEYETRKKSRGQIENIEIWILVP